MHTSALSRIWQSTVLTSEHGYPLTPGEAPGDDHYSCFLILPVLTARLLSYLAIQHHPAAICSVPSLSQPFCSPFSFMGGTTLSIPQSSLDHHKNIKLSSGPNKVGSQGLFASNPALADFNNDLDKAKPSLPLSSTCEIRNCPCLWRRLQRKCLIWLKLNRRWKECNNVLISFELEHNIWDKFTLDQKKLFGLNCILYDNILFWWRNENFNP